MDFDFYRFVTQLLQPYTLLHVLIGAALIVLWRRKPEMRKALRWIAAPFALLVLMGLPATSFLALASLEWPYPPSLERPSDAKAIVVLNAGINFADKRRPRAELDFDTMLRCVHAAELYHEGPPCPIVVTGGPEKPGGPGPSCAEVMRDFLMLTGVPESDILLETTSLTTFENARECKSLLADQGIDCILLVTDAAHMYRSLRCFEHQGLRAYPSACRHGATEFKLRPENFLPNPMAAQNCRRAFHEWMGLAWYKLKGRI